MCLTLYAMASVGYYNQEFFESAFLSFTKPTAEQLAFANARPDDTLLDLADLAAEGQVPHIDQLAYLSQSAAILRRPEFTPMLIKWLASNLVDQELSLFRNDRSDKRMA